MVAWAVVAAIVVFAGARAMGQRSSPQQEPLPVKVDGGGGRTSSSSSRAEATARVFVHVAGAVRRPGLYRMAAGTRVAVAIDRAGGARGRANLAAVNLAAKVQDGQQVVVPGPGSPAPATAAAGGDSGPGSAGAGGAKISLGTATVAQLETLDGIGPALAKRIVEYRTAHGGFRSLEQLQEVDGIGVKRFAALREAVSP